MDEQLGVNDRLEKVAGKNLSEPLLLRGEFEILHIRDGHVIARREVKNLVVSAGKGQAAGLLNGAVTTPMKYIAIGTGTIAPAAGDTALGAEMATGGGARALATTLDRVTTTVTNDTARAIVTFAFTASFAVTEAGLFDAAAAGNMLSRQTFAAVNVVSGDSLQVTWKIQVS